MLKRAVVSGGAGFIGSHLCEALLGKGYAVVCVDNLVTGAGENISHLKKNKNFLFLKQDITKPLPEKIFEKQKIDLVFNFASPASPVDYQKLPIETLRAGSLGTFNMLELALKTRARFVHASTSEVYGDPLEHPQKETYWGNVNPLGPRSMYDEAKRFAESLCMAFHRKHGLDVRILRIFNTYGPRMRLNDGRAVPNFFVQALSGKPLTLYGDGSQTRSFCYVDDLVEAIVAAAEKQGISGEAINLGNPDEYTVKQLAEKIIAVTRSRSKLVFKPLPQDDPLKRRPDISKAQSLLGWMPKTSLGEGLKRTANYFKKKLFGKKAS